MDWIHLVKKYSLGILAIFIASAPAYAWPTIGPRGTTFYDPGAAYNCYMLFCPMDAPETPERTSFPVYLINMSGRVVHQWSVPFVPLQGQLLRNGNVVVLGLNRDLPTDFPKIEMKNAMGGYADQLVELSWEGKTLFHHSDPDMHHDFAKLPNGNYMYLAWEVMPKALRDKVRGGFKDSEHLLFVPQDMRKQYFAGQIFRGQDMRVMFNDYLVEINPQGRKVWEWHANKHLDPNIDIVGPLYKREEWLHSNSIGLLKNGKIVLTNRNTDSILIIDKKTGKINFRWGNVAHLNKQSRQIEYQMVPLTPFAEAKSPTLGGPHDAREIPTGFPGAGHLTVYNNGVYAGFSRVVEIDPVARQVVWQSKHIGHGRRPFSAFVGGAQRLPNGNTLICEGINGRFFQITKDSEIAWEYINPHDRSRLFRGAVMKIQAYAPDYCPQFEKLPPAKGPAVTSSSMNAVDQLEMRTVAAEKNAQTAETAVKRYQLAVIVLLTAVAALTFLLRQQLVRGS